METTKIKVILIDPSLKSITYSMVKQDANELCKLLECKYLQEIRVFDYPKVFAICDENARVDGSNNKAYFKLGQHVFVNRVALLGTDDGDLANVPMRLTEATKKVKFLGDDYVDPEPSGFVYIDIDAMTKH